MKISEVLIDGDEIVYKIGFACQISQYEICGPKGPTGCINKAKEAACEDIGIDLNHDYDLSKEWITLPWELCKKRVDFFIRSTLRTTDCNQYRVFLSGAKVFRKDVGTILPYKGNRAPDGRPIYYQAIRDFLSEEYYAESQEHLEADDQLGIAHLSSGPAKSGSVLCSQDKDLKMIPGRQYNPWRPNDPVRTISVDEANRTFFKQLLTGDSTDNIPGIANCGPVAASKVIDPCHTIEQMSDAVYYAYSVAIKNTAEGKTKRSDFHFPYDIPETMSLYDVVNEIAKLIWIWREPTGANILLAPKDE